MSDQESSAENEPDSDSSLDEPQ
jgi:hypothetical protein